MRRIWTKLAVPLVAVAVLGGCGGDEKPSPAATTTSAPATTTTTSTIPVSTTLALSPEEAKAVQGLKAALLAPADIPGSTTLTQFPPDLDFSACFPGNPLGVQTDPAEVKGERLVVKAGDVQHQYGSKVRRGTAEQVKDFVSTLASPTGSACAFDVYKARASSAAPTRPDVSGVTSTASAVKVGEGGALLAISGPITIGSSSTQVGVDLLVFQKGPRLVFVTISAIGGPTVPGQVQELAQKIATRLP